MDMAAAVNRVMGGVGATSKTVIAIKALPQQNQLVLCATARLLGDPLGQQQGPSATPLKPATGLAVRLPNLGIQNQSTPIFVAKRMKFALVLYA